MAFIIAVVDVKNPKDSDILLTEDGDDAEVFYRKEDADRAVADLKEDAGPGFSYHILEVK